MNLSSNLQVYLEPRLTISFNKPEIDVLDMVLSSATKNVFGTQENNDIVYSLYRMFLNYARQKND